MAGSHQGMMQLVHTASHWMHVPLALLLQLLLLEHAKNLLDWRAQINGSPLEAVAPLAAAA